ncbi:MAG: GTPase domain-containing protein [Deltaproteobacteria bacterium]|nr:GTPase domain-containing protein [Deltaproteobacteria bacterium]
MALFNYATRELSAKVVYYGPGLSGKTTNIEMVHHLLKPEQKGRLISLPTETDRTLFFDFLPLDLGQIKGFKVRFHLYTVPGQVFYNATRRLVLQGVDGVVFVADSQVDMMSSNLESLKNLRDNLTTYGKKIEDLPFVMQYNKRDLKKITSVKEISAQLNDLNVPTYEGVAKDGIGVIETLVGISRLVFANLRKSLLLPGETEDLEEAMEIADVAAVETQSPGEAESLEEISEIEEIPDLSEVAEIPDVPDVQEIPETTEVPEGVEIIVPPREVSPESFPEETPVGDGESLDEAAQEEVSPLADIPEEIEIEIPERFDEPPPAREARTGVSVKVEGEGLTFLKFEDVFVSREGHAVLPAVFLDAEGNPVRIRIRVSMEEGQD